MGPQTEVMDFIFPAFILAMFLIFCWIAKQVCEHQNKSKAKVDEEDHCHFCGDGEFFQVGWDVIYEYEGAMKKIKGTSMVHQFTVHRVKCPNCGRLSQPCESFKTIPAPRFNYNRHL